MKQKPPQYPLWHQRAEITADGKLDEEHFIKLADQFISLANSRNKRVLATELQYVMMFASARYAAHVGKNVLELDEHESFVEHMTAQFKDMLREHLADPSV